MAWVDEKVWSWTVNFQDRARKKFKVEAGIRNTDGANAAVTEATARAKLLAIATAMQAVSCAMVVGTVLRLETQDAEAAPVNADNPYRTIEDRLRLIIGDSKKDRGTPILLPAPKADKLMADKETVNSANAELQEVLTWLATNAISYAGNKLVEYISGERERGTGQRLIRGLKQIQA